MDKWSEGWRKGGREKEEQTAKRYTDNTYIKRSIGRHIDRQRRRPERKEKDKAG